MTLTLEPTPQVEKDLLQEAARLGRPLQKFDVDALQRGMDDWMTEEEEDAADVAEIQRRLTTSDPSKRRTLAELRVAIYGSEVTSPDA